MAHNSQQISEKDFQAHKKALYKYYNWDPNMTLKIDPDAEFLEPQDYEWCPDPFHCCFEDAYLDLGTQWESSTRPSEIFHESKLTESTWYDGSPIDKIAPPMRIEDTCSYFQPKPGVLMNSILKKVGKGWDPNLQNAVPCTYRAESSGPVNAEITTEEQGTPVNTQVNAPSAQLDALAVASTGKTVDKEWETFFSYHTNINWSTQEPQGKILFKQSLSPLLNSYLEHLSKLYAAWSGSIDIRFSVSGSGVYGGKLAAIVIPPGIEPVESTSMLQYPHVLFDARQTEPVIFTVPDIRSKLYHDLSDTDTTTLVIMVYNELINPYESADKTSGCSITVETKPSLDFKFSLLKPPGALLTHGSIPSNLIPRKSSLWRGNRCWTDIDGFVILPRVFQANRHFNFDQETAGWSTPYFRPFEVVAVGNDKLHKVVAVQSLVDGIPDGWPDTTIKEKLTPEASGYSFEADGVTTNSTFTKEAYEQAVAAGIKNTTSFRGMYVCGALQRRWGDNKISETAFVTVGKINNNDVIPTNRIDGDSCVLFQDTHHNSNTTDASADYLSLLAYTGFEEDIIGTDESRVVRISTLPEAYINGSNYPIFYRNTMKLGGVLKQIHVANSQILTTSRQLAENNYMLPQDSLAVYRITDSASNWFDIGIDSEGFSYVGMASGLNSLTFPLSSAFVGIQLAKVKLASNIKASKTKL